MAEKNYIDKNGLLYVWTKIKTLLTGKVDKVEGMGLSHNDLTDELKEKIMNAGDSSFDGQYSSLTGKPKINNVELSAENSLADLGIASATDLENKVDKVEGKGLSTEDFTTEEKTKLASIVPGSDANTIESISVNGTAVEPDESKNVEIAVPTKTSDILNDSNYQTDAEVDAAIKAELAKINKKEVVESLDAMTNPNTIYLMANAGEQNNIYDEYIVIEVTEGEGETATTTLVKEKIGTTQVDLTNYVQESDLMAISNDEIDEIFAK